MTGGLTVAANAQALYIGDTTNTSAYQNFNGRTYVGYNNVGFAVLQGGLSKGIQFNVHNATFGSGTAMTLDTGGLLGIGVSPTTSNGYLQLPASTSLATGGIAWGTDTNLYRSAADTLRTDDAFNVAGGSITLLNGTSNRIFYGTTGVAAPGSGSVGEKIQLYGTAGTVGTGDYALGIESNHFWLNSGGGYKFYGTTTLRMTLDSSGLLGIGVTPTTSNGYLQLPAGTTLSTGGIAWGTDTNLYRSGADTLRTDDRLILRPTLSSGGIISGLDVDNNPSAATQRTIGLISFATTGDSSLPSVYAAGVEGRVISNATGANTVPTSYGLNFSVENRSSGIMTDARGVNVAVGNYSTGTGTITNAYGVYVDVNQTGAGSGAITTGHGIYIRDVNAGTSWGVYQVGTNDFNYFGGYVGLGVNVTGNIVSRLTLGAATDAAGGITWGTDTNLYRSAAGILRTDGSLQVAGTGNSYFVGGTIAFGQTTASAKLDATASTVPTLRLRQAGANNYFEIFNSTVQVAIDNTYKLVWSGDTNLYRSAADTLKTDDNLIVAAAGTAANSVATIDATQTLTNKRVTKRTSTVASSATPTPNGDTDDLYTVTALATAATFGAPTGTPTEGQSLIIRIKDNGTARSLSWNAIYRIIGTTLPTTTVLNKTLYLGFIYNATDSKWDCLAVSQEA